LIFFTLLHTVIMESWHRFREAQKSIAQESDHNHRVREKRKSEEEAIRLEGQRRQIDLSHVARNSVLLQYACRQANNCSYFDGSYLNDTSRHLNFAI
jgi:hypothetical protein